MSREPKEDYDWINDPFDEKKIAEERERMGMSGTSKTFVGIGCQLSDDWTYYTDEQLAELFVLGFIVLIGLLLFGIL